MPGTAHRHHRYERYLATTFVGLAFVTTR